MGGAKKTRMGGFVIYNLDRKIHYVVSCYYGMDCPINNMAEIQSPVDLAIWLYQNHYISPDHTTMITTNS